MRVALGHFSRRLALFMAMGAFLAWAFTGMPKQIVLTAQAQTTTAGGPLPGLTLQEQQLFNLGKNLFNLTWFPTVGLGPVFTNSGCARCHAQPASGGSSNTLNTLFGALNPDGSFNSLTNEGGPLLQPFSLGQVLPASKGCTLTGEVIPADATIISHRRVPLVFGAGLIESIPDATILANSGVDQGDGIKGVANMVADLNGKIRPGRFGFKAQFPELLQITAAAMVHELGVTSPFFPNEDLPQGNPIPPNCVADNNQPNDTFGTGALEIFQFQMFLAPNAAAALTAAGQAGQQTFLSIGCAKCHIPSMQTAGAVFVPLNPSGTKVEGPSAALSNQTVNLYSDLLLHDMGAGLADNFPQGQASGSQWRTTPLWGLSTKTTFLHDGSASDLTTAIQRHGGEASIVISSFNALSAQDQANLLTFLKSL